MSESGIADLKIVDSLHFEPESAAGAPIATEADVQPLIAEGVLAHQAGNLGLAETKYRAALQIDPAHPEALLMLGVIACQMSDHGAAVTLIGNAIANHPDRPKVPSRYYINLANALHGAARLDDAVVALHRALTTDPDSVEGHFNLANVLGDLDRSDEAEVEYRYAIELQPRYARAHAGLGKALERLGRRSEAIEALQAALDLEPFLDEPRRELGRLLTAECRFDEALPLLDGEPGKQDTETALALGACHTAHLEWEKARDAFAGVIKTAPRESRAHAGLGEALYRLGETETALTHLLRAGELDLKAFRPIALAGIISLEQGDLALAVSRLEKAIDGAPRDQEAHSALIYARSLLATDTDAATLAEGVKWQDRFGGCAPMPAASISRLEPHRTLRVGFLTGRNPGDTALQALLPVLGYRRPGQIETHCYADLDDSEQLAGVLAKLADRWTDTRTLTDGALCTAIHGDEIDILVDLGGVRMGNRLRVLSRRPAPVQVAWLGQTDPLGLGFIDYRLTDGRQGAEALDAGAAGEAESALPAANGMLAFVAPEEFPTPGPLPMLQGTGPRFVSMGGLAQFSEESVALFSRALTEVADSRLRLIVLQSLHRDTGRRLRRRFADYGVAEQRVELVSLADKAKDEDISLEALFADADLALDPFPASNGFESFLALIWGLPVVSLAGPLAASGVTAGLLQSMRLGSLRAASIEEFVRSIVTLIENPDKLSDLRAGLPGLVATSPVVDGAGFAGGFEDALRAAWSRHCALKKPASQTRH